MEDLIGVYGILDRDHWPEALFQLLDGGVEIRWKEPYAFHNAERGTYSGWLMQYTLSGTGWFEKNGKTYDAALEYRKECGRDCSRNRIFQWKLFWKSIPSPYGNLAVGIPERTAERCRLKSEFCTKK